MTSLIILISFIIFVVLIVYGVNSLDERITKLESTINDNTNTKK